MNDRFDQLILLPPPAGTPWSGAAGDLAPLEILREDRAPISMGLPVFWYDPKWCGVAAETADFLAVVVGQHGVLVSALRSDLSGPENEPHFHEPQGKAADDDESETANSDLRQVLPRILPYRPERYGLNVRDFDGATIVDVRLAMTRDASGRFAFSPSQIQRWEATLASEPLSGGGWVPAAPFPPDIASMDQLASKLNQLRSLASQAAVFASMSPYRMKAELPRILKARPDGLILQLNDDSLSGLQVAALTRRARKMMNEAGATSVPLWVVPGEITPDDAVKLIALGASAIAVDSWCDPLITESAQRQHASVARLGYTAASHDDLEYLRQLTQYHLLEKIERFRGLYQSIQRIPPSDRIGSFSSIWAQPLEVKALR